MNKSLMYTMSGVALLLLLFFLNQSQQSKYNLSSNLIFNGDSELIHRIIMNGSKGDTLELVKTDTTWTMTQADTLILKDRQFNQLFERLIGGKYDMIVSNNIQKWSKFGVTDSLGRSIRLFDKDNRLLGHYIFGNKGQDYSHNYVRVYDKKEVYRTVENVYYLLNTNPTFFGKNPPKKEPKKVELKEEINIDTTSSR